jgi:hypothetical protein
MDKIIPDLILVSAVLLTIFGFLGNSLTVFIFVKPKFSNKSIFRYLTTLSINNCLVLSTMWPFVLSGIHKDYMNSISCKLIQYFGSLFYTACPWILVVSSIDRLIAIKYPLRFIFRKKKKFQVCLLLILFICMIFSNIPIYMYNNFNADSPMDLICSINDPYIKYKIDQIFSVLTLFIPLIIISLCIIMIWEHLSSNRILFLQNRKKHRQKIESVKLLFALNIFYLICNSPYWIQQIIFDLCLLNNNKPPYSTYIYFITNFLTYVQNSFTFFIYIFFNKNFRNYVSFGFSDNRIVPQ